MTGIDTRLFTVKENMLFIYPIYLFSLFEYSVVAWNVWNIVSANQEPAELHSWVLIGQNHVPFLRKFQSLLIFELYLLVY